MENFMVKIECEVISSYRDIITIAVFVDGYLSEIFAVKNTE